jgi:hypothetical protein
MKHRVPAIRHLAVAAAVLVAALAPAGVAMATDSEGTIEIHEQATLLARGAAVGVVVTVTCSPEFGREYLYLTLTQRQGNEVVQSGTSGVLVDCDGTPQTMDVNVQAGQAPFRRGPAFVSARMYVCNADYSHCGIIDGSGEITIEK